VTPSPEPLDLTACDREPIHIPGAIQPHGCMFVADRDTLEVVRGAGDIEERLGLADWRGRALGDLIGDPVAARIGRAAHSGGAPGFMGQFRAASGALFDVVAHRVGDVVLVELEPGSPGGGPASETLGVLEAAGASFARASGLQDLCERAVRQFRQITGYDRVMIYRFLDDEAGVVLAEDKAPELPGFLNHHFPGSDIPRQARALYVRNLVRVIPDAGYTPRPLRPELAGEPLDMSDCVLRSVSPIHLKYLRNMGVVGSASISIVDEDRLWGLVACHHRSRRLMPYEVRAACRTLAGSLARQIKARQEAEHYRERVRLRGLEDEVYNALWKEPRLDAALAAHAELVRRFLGADGLAVIAGDQVTLAGATPDAAALNILTGWAEVQAANGPWATNRLSSVFPPAAAFQDLASGLLAVVVSPEEPLILLWTRAERLQVVEWAGNPHKAMEAGADGLLNPRASFEAWSDTVRGVALDWSSAELETAARFRIDLLELQRQQRLFDLNRQLRESLAEREQALAQKEVLMREMNHRIQNSLQLVSSFLALQARASDDAQFQDAVEEARRRLGAVSLVHRRLYRADQIEKIDMARYLEELWEEMVSAMDPEWSRMARLELSPVMVSTDKAVTLGLIATELIINANKYAYDGAPGRIDIAVEQAGRDIRLIVADQGRGRARGADGTGFGSRMMQALVSQLSGELDYQPGAPGTRAVLTAPLES
jgi:light-regulated signal transduction histidine kinase (bacteriophytochrome)